MLQADCPHWSHLIPEPPVQHVVAMSPCGHARYFWRLRSGSGLKHSAFAARRSPFPNSCASMVNPKWNMPEVLHHCSSFGASSLGKTTNHMGKDIQEACIGFVLFRFEQHIQLVLQNSFHSCSIFKSFTVGKLHQKRGCSSWLEGDTTMLLPQLVPVETIQQGRQTRGGTIVVLPQFETRS